MQLEKELDRVRSQLNSSNETLSTRENEYCDLELKHEQVIVCYFVFVFFL